MDEAIEEVMAKDICSINATVTEQAVAEASAEAEANAGLGLATLVLETVVEAEALEAVAEGDLVTIVSLQSGDPEAMTLEEASPKKHGM
uniref:Uncharacterized protein n=1 Tax=Oryza punctata TaxID=4537 RepID=A0A0E0LBJ3_ORYPU